MPVRQQKNINFQIKTLPTVQHRFKAAPGLWLAGALYDRAGIVPPSE